MITFNRAEYTEKSICRLLESATENTKIVIWDNNSNPETKNIVKKYEKHSKIENVIYNDNNDKLWKPTNWFFSTSGEYDLIGKVDDDCLVPKEWIKILRKFHEKLPELGLIGCWRFLPEDFNKEVAENKIQKFGKHRIMRNCWIEGSGYLMKRAVVSKIGYLRKNESFTDYCIRAAAKGFINGWYYPFLYQEHMDDPRTENTGIKSDEDFQRLIPLSAKTFNIQTKDEWIQRLKKSAKMLQEYSINPNDFIGIKPQIKRKILKLIGRKYFPKFKGNLQSINR